MDTDRALELVDELELLLRRVSGFKMKRFYKMRQELEAAHWAVIKPLWDEAVENGRIPNFPHAE